MSRRPSWEVLIGDPKLLDHLATRQSPEKRQPHPLQKRLEEIVATELDEHEQEIFYLRFGEQMSFRNIAKELGYDSHQTFQYHVEKIMRKVVEALER